MLPLLNRKKVLYQTLIILTFLFISESSFSQSTEFQDTIIRVPRGSYIQFNEKRSFIPKDTTIKVPGSMVFANHSGNDRTITFYDSLKSKASKKTITKALYDLVIVSPDTSNKSKITSNSRENFIEYSGRKIRNINIQRLNVFGANIDNPGQYNPHGVEKILNSTHINTNENIIKKYLLFSEGDSLSPLTLSDNERIIRQLPYIDDARIIVIPVSSEEADILVVTKDVYSLGGSVALKSPTSGTVRIFERNIFGMGHEFELDIPYSSGTPDSPGIGLNYNINNIQKSFIDLNLNYANGLGNRTYGISLEKKLISTATKYAGGVTVRETFTTEDLDTLPVPQPLKINFQDFWVQRSFLINEESATRIIIGARYTNNNVFQRPVIGSNSYHSIQRYKFIIGSAALSVQQYYKTNLIYNYGRTEDVPYGMLFRLSAGLEMNEFKERAYSGIDISFGQSAERLGYFYLAAGYGAYFREGNTEQGVLQFRMKHFSNLLYLGRYKIRNFVNAEYTRGFNRYTDEYLVIPKKNGFSGFANDSLRGGQRLILSLESVVFSPANFFGFRFAFFGFVDMAFLGSTKDIIDMEGTVTSLGLGLRIRNDNLIFNTFQIRIGYFPDPPQYSRISNIVVSGEQLLRPNNFDPGPPIVIPYR